MFSNDGKVAQASCSRPCLDTRTLARLRRDESHPFCGPAVWAPKLPVAQPCCLAERSRLRSELALTLRQLIRTDHSHVRQLLNSDTIAVYALGIRSRIVTLSRLFVDGIAVAGDTNRLRNIIGFHQSDAGGAVTSTHDRRVRSRRDCFH